MIFVQKVLYSQFWMVLGKTDETMTMINSLSMLKIYIYECWGLVVSNIFVQTETIFSWCRFSDKAKSYAAYSKYQVQIMWKIQEYSRTRFELYAENSNSA